MRSWKKVLLTAACGAMAATTLTACGGGSGAGDDTTFTMWLYNSVDSSYYTDYAENPVVQYTTQNMTWGDENKKVSFEFWVPADDDRFWRLCRCIEWYARRCTRDHAGKWHCHGSD